jgi:hypothetical protein
VAATSTSLDHRVVRRKPACKWSVTTCWSPTRPSSPKRSPVGPATLPLIKVNQIGTGCGQLKTGAPARGERVAKYNRLIEIEADQDLAYGLA